jgi:hypothetical protein
MLLFTGYTVKGDVIVDGITVPCQVQVDSNNSAEAEQYFYNQAMANYQNSSSIEFGPISWLKIG